MANISVTRKEYSGASDSITTPTDGGVDVGTGSGGGILLPGVPGQQNDPVDTLHSFFDSVTILTAGGPFDVGVGHDDVGSHFVDSAVVTLLNSHQNDKAQGFVNFDRGGLWEDAVFLQLVTASGFVYGNYTWTTPPTGAGNPSLVTASVVNGTRLRVSFNRSMLLDYPQSVVQDPNSYYLRETVSGEIVRVLIVEQFNSQTVDLVLASEMSIVGYTLTVYGVQDSFGNVISPNPSSVTFTGAPSSFPAITAIDLFVGYGAGMGTYSQGDVSPDLTPPSLQNLAPFNGETGVDPRTDIYLEVIDASEFGVGSDGVTIFVNNVAAVIDGVAQAGFTVSKLAILNGWSYDIDPGVDLPEAATTYVRVVAQDQAPLPNVLDTTYSFNVRILDLDPPLLQNLNPPSGTLNHPYTSPIVLEVVDYKSGVTASTVIITVGGVIAWTSDAQQNGWTVLKETVSYGVGTGGFRYTLSNTSGIPIGAVSVRVQASDSFSPPLSLDTTYSITVVDTVAPVFSLPNPGVGATGVSKTTFVSFTLNDPGAGINLSSLDVVIGGLNAIVGGSFQSGFQGASSVITPSGTSYQVTIDKQTDYPSFADITVAVDAEDSQGNPVSAVWSWKVEDYLGPVVTPINPTSGQTNVTITTNIAISLADEDGIDLDSLMVEINQGSGYETAFVYTDNPKFHSGWNGAGSSIVLSPVLTITIDPESPLPPNSTISVRVTALDLTGNEVRL